MKKRASQSTLQNQILLYMESGRFESLTELASKLKVHRSSVSRAMNALLDLGLVSKVGKNWELTEDGRNEISSLRGQLSERVAKTSKTATRLLEQGTLAALSLNQPRPALSDVSAVVGIKGWEPDASMLGVVQKLADSVAGLNSLAIMQDTLTPRLRTAVPVDLHSSTETMARHLEELGLSRDAYVQGLSAAMVRDDILLSTQALFQPFMDATKNFDVGAKVYESMKHLFDTPDFASAFAHALADQSLMSGLSSRTLASTVDAVKFATLKPSIAEIMAERAWPIIEDYTQPVVQGLCSQLANEAFTSLAQSQRLSLASIEQLAPYGKVTSPLLTELSRTNVRLSQLLRDFGTVCMQDLTPDVLTPAVAAQFSAVASITRAYKGYLADVIGRVGTEIVYPSWEVGVTLPTWTTGAYVDSVNAILLPAAQDTEETLPYADDDIYLDRPTQFDAVFEKLGPKYIRKWQGSWSTLQSDGSDRISQAAHSGRELLMQLLADFAPDSSFTETEIQQHGHRGKVTRKMRVKRILQENSNSAVQWAESVAKALDETCDMLTGTSHCRDDYPPMTEHQLSCLLHALGSWVAFIESFQRRS